MIDLFVENPGFKDGVQWLHKYSYGAAVPRIVSFPRARHKIDGTHAAQSTVIGLLAREAIAIAAARLRRIHSPEHESIMNLRFAVEQPWRRLGVASPPIRSPHYLTQSSNAGITV